jgi:hypothetical protein
MRNLQSRRGLRYDIARFTAIMSAACAPPGVRSPQAGPLFRPSTRYQSRLISHASPVTPHQSRPTSHASSVTP